MENKQLEVLHECVLCPHGNHLNSGLLYYRDHF